jgi:7-cyano-7-deazaguanine reductase
MTTKTFLGKETAYPERYAPELLCAVPREENRRVLGIRETLPFHGHDIWNAFEITWLEPAGKPAVAVGDIRVGADSPFLIESKSLKLYLNSLAMQHFAAADDVAALIAKDLSDVTKSRVQVVLRSPAAAVETGIATFPGHCIDDVDVACDTWQVDPSLLRCEGQETLREELHTHLLRSKCPVTGQPDFGSVLVRYQGPKIDRAALLRYLVSFRNHNDFHESCIERIFIDLKRACAPTELTVYGRFNRRGGLDINPFRSDFESAVDNPRLWRQ